MNAGAIAACSLVEPVGDADGKWKAIVDNITELTGTKPKVIKELYESESATDFNNRSIAWLLKDYGRIYDDPDLSLDLYTRQCSLGTTARDLAVMAATIANDGFNPVTDKQVFDPDLAPKVTSMITTVGFYERTGDWLYKSGLPAKSGVGGGVLGVMPGMFGIAASIAPAGRGRELREGAAGAETDNGRARAEHLRRQPPLRVRVTRGSALRWPCPWD